MSYLKSLDPRISRQNIPTDFGSPFGVQSDIDQFETYEVFVQPKEDKPYQHEGIVHAPTLEMAFLFAKEQYSRRGFSCSGIWVVATNSIKVSPITEDKQSVYDFISADIISEKGEEELYHLFHLMKRGRQHQLVGSVEATSYEAVMVMAKEHMELDKPVYNIWVIKDADMLKIEGEDMQPIWETLPDKKYRDAIDYKAADKIKKFKEEQAS
jgi:ring-1,2-phenylacetyl-CoA epoxidase subunit PaaB